MITFKDEKRPLIIGVELYELEYSVRNRRFGLKLVNEPHRIRKSDEEEEVVLRPVLKPAIIGDPDNLFITIDDIDRHV